MRARRSWPSSRAGSTSKQKGDLSPVTEADRAAELIILAALAVAAPGVPVIAEEEVAAGRIPDHGDMYFLVDPLDGTKEFVRGGDDYTVNIGLIVDGSPRLGVVYAPATGRLHGGIVGRGAWVEEGAERRAIACRPCGGAPVAVASKSHFSQPTADYLDAVGARRPCLGRIVLEILHRRRRVRPTSIRVCRQPASGTQRRDMRCCSPRAGGSTGPTGRRSGMASLPSSTADLSPPAEWQRRRSGHSSPTSRAAETCRRGVSKSFRLLGQIAAPCSEVAPIRINLRAEPRQAGAGASHRARRAPPGCARAAPPLRRFRDARRQAGSPGAALLRAPRRVRQASALGHSLQVRMIGTKWPLANSLRRSFVTRSLALRPQRSGNRLTFVHYAVYPILARFICQIGGSHGRSVTHSTRAIPCPTRVRHRC